MSQQFKLASAGNTEPPIYFLLIEKGYEISINGEYWIAENSTSKFTAYNVLELAGLIMLYENKGKNWHVNDDKIEEFIKKKSTTDLMYLKFIHSKH